jgi:choloylglycine hydrolase
VCTSLRIKAGDGTVLVGRTMEYALDINWELRAVPRGVRQSSMLPDGPGLTWQGRYGYVGTGSGETIVGGTSIPAQASVPDGVNEQGLYAGLLYLPSYAEYEDPAGAARSELVAPIDLAAYVLATCATVAEAVSAMEHAVVCAVPMPVIGVPPLHLVLHDRGGAAAVVEWVGGTRHVYDNPTGVATNSPPLDWHLANLRNYVNQTALDVPPLTVDGMTLAPLGEGSGMLGLPGDFTPPSRFVRAAAFAATARKPGTAAAGLTTVMHLLSSFDITKGVIRDPSAAALAASNGDSVGDYTSFRAACELSAAPAYTVQTYDDFTPRRVALRDIELSGGPARVRKLAPALPPAVSF